MTWLDQAADGALLEWRRHRLSDALLEAGRWELEHEPWPRRPEDVTALVPRATTKGEVTQVCLERSWSRLRLTPRTVGGFPLLPTAKTQELHNVGCLQISWRQLAPCDAVELTPIRDDGSMGEPEGATLRLNRPPSVPWVWFNFGHDVATHREKLTIEPAEPTHAKALRCIKVRLFKLVGHYRFVSAKPDVPSGAQWTWNLEVPRSFRGVVAVIAEHGGRERLLDCTEVNERFPLGHPRDETTWRAIRAQVEGTAEPRQWPDRSHQRLAELRHEAMRRGFQPVDELLRDHPLGVARAVILAVLDLPPISPASAGAPSSLTEVLGAAAPGLLDALDRAASPQEILWATGHARAPGLAEALQWAAGTGPEGLERALALVPRRRRIAELRRMVRRRAPEADELRALQARFERAPIDCGPSEDIERRLEEIEDQVEQSRREPIDVTGPAPMTAEQYRQWLVARRSATRWRRAAAGILDFCTTGAWPRPARETEPIADLAARAAVLGAPETVEHAAPGESAELERRLHELLERIDDEPPSNERQRLVTFFERQVLPQVDRWAGMHAVLRRADTLERERPALAAILARVSSGEPALDERARRAGVALAVVDELDRYGAGCLGNGIASLADEPLELEAILADPSHPRIAAARRELAELERLLDSAAPDSPIDGGARTLDLDVESFRRWWRDLETLAHQLTALRRGRRDLGSQVEWFRHRMVPDLERWVSARAGREEEEPELQARTRRALELLRGGRELSRTEYEDLVELQGEIHGSEGGGRR